MTVDRIELVRKIPYDQLSPADRKGLKKDGYAARAVIVHLDGLKEDVEFVKALLMKENNTEWPVEE